MSRGSFLGLIFCHYDLEASQIFLIDGVWVWILNANEIMLKICFGRGPLMILRDFEISTGIELRNFIARPRPIQFWFKGTQAKL